MENKRVMIDVDHVTVRFNLANQKVDNLKEYFVKLVKKYFEELMSVAAGRTEKPHWSKPGLPRRVNILRL